MLVFSTRLPLKKEVTRQECLRLFTEWITGSRHYPIDRIDYDPDSRQDREFREGNTRFSIKHYGEGDLELSACRFENKEKEAVWISDCVFLAEGEKKSLLIQLNCNLLEYGDRLPRGRKPHIVRKFVKSGLCREDGGIPVSDRPHPVEEGFFDLCAAIMRGEGQNTMPAVYVSCGYQGGTAIDPSDLANQLGGVAHVFLETNRDTALRLRDATGGNNAHTGYVGVYFPGSRDCQRHGIEYYRGDAPEMSRSVIDSVRRALVNRVDASLYNWNQITALQSRQKMLEWQNISTEDKKQLQEYIRQFDLENRDLLQQVEDLSQQNYSLQARLDALRSAGREDGEGFCFLKAGKEQPLYATEQKELLRSILSQVLEKYPDGSRGRAIIHSILEANPATGECAKIKDGVRKVFQSGGKMSAADKSLLKKLGFIIEEDGPHYKMTFRDPRYTFTVSRSPGDHREGKNMISDICKIIDVERKI